MTRRLKKYLPALKRLKRSTSKERRLLLRSADDGLIECLAECAHNTLNNVVPLTSSQYKKLSRHKRILRLLADTKIKIKSKKKAVTNQCGGFILPLLAPIIGAIIQGLILK
jgi:hypothetical protein